MKSLGYWKLLKTSKGRMGPKGMRDVYIKPCLCVCNDGKMRVYKSDKHIGVDVRTGRGIPVGGREGDAGERRAVMRRMMEVLKRRGRYEGEENQAWATV